MKILLTIIFLCFLGSASEAQKEVTPKVKYTIWIYLNDTSKPLQGVILGANDSTIQFVDKVFLRKNQVIASYSSKAIPFASIEKIKIRSKKNVSKGFLIGTLSGAAQGAAAGYIQGDDTCDPNACLDCMFAATAEEKASGGAVVGALAGMGAGLLIGSARKTIEIKGSQVLYLDKLDELKSYSLHSQ